MRRLIPSVVLSPEELEALGQRMMGMTSSSVTWIDLFHTARGIARVAQNRVRTNNDGSEFRMGLTLRTGQRAYASLEGDQRDDDTLRRQISYLEQIAAKLPVQFNEAFIPRTHTYPPTHLWFDSTVDALATTRDSVLPPMIRTLVDHQQVGSAFVGLMARTMARIAVTGRHILARETDTELTVMGWTPDGTGAGWAGQATRDWSQMQPEAVAAEAARLTALDANPVAVEPGRQTVIFGPAAMAQFAHAMSYAWDAEDAATPMIDPKTGKFRLGERVLDERITIEANPDDPDGGYLPFDINGTPMVPMRFVENGVLTNMAFTPGVASWSGIQPSTQPPFSMRMSGGANPPTTIEAMIAQCEKGIYVNRVANVSLMNSMSGTVTGLTYGGCYMVEHGQVTKAVKNMRFIDSPFFFLNNLIAIGTPHRTAFGYSPWTRDEWPIPPSIVPPVMVRDFNFTRLADAV